MYKWDSKEEEYFFWYVEELQEAGFIDNIKYQPKPFPLFDGAKYTFNKQLKTKSKSVTRTLLKPHQYQADFLLGWSDIAIDVFFAVNSNTDMLKLPFYAYLLTKNDEYRSVVDVKGTFNQNDAWRRFSIEQKWVWDKYQIYVQKIIPQKLFKDTFTPSRYLLTDKSGKPRKINWEIRTLAEFITSQ
jgi:hypothetical protein